LRSKFADLSGVGADFDHAIVLPRNLFHVFCQGYELAGFAGVLFLAIFYVFPISLIKSAEFEADIVVDLIFGREFHDTADALSHDPFKSSILIETMICFTALHLFTKVL
jgi:hypothetical protein